MISYLIEDYLSRNKMFKKDFADRLGFSEKTITNWTKRRQVPTYFSAQCLLELFTEDIISKAEKLIYEDMFWGIWETEYVWRINKLRTDRGLKTESPKHLLQHVKSNKQAA